MNGRKVLNYCPSLNQITGSITASLLMCQLEYWFHKTKGKAFYKFLEPCIHSHYKKGDSWTEELSFSKAEFRLAFNRIGKVYKSKQAYLDSKDPFEGKFYLSYYDRGTRCTYYIRNTASLNELLRNQQCELPYTEDYNSSLSKSFIKDDKTDIGDTDKIVKLFMTHCPSLKEHVKLTSKCRSHLSTLSKLLQKKGLALWSTLKQVFELVENSDFLCGRLPHSTWHAVLEWILRPDKFFAILEGKYAPFKPLPASSSHLGSSYVPSNFSHRLSGFIRPFNRVESHHFNLEELEAKERAYHESKYLKKFFE